VQRQTSLDDQYADVISIKIADANEPVVGLMTAQFTAETLAINQIDHEPSF
jgi:hypothetical protein